MSEPESRLALTGPNLSLVLSVPNRTTPDTSLDWMRLNSNFVIQLLVVNRVADTYLILCGNFIDSGNVAGNGVNESVVATQEPSVLETIMALLPLNGWRCVLMTTYNCIDGTGNAGGIAEYLYYADGTRHPAPLRWASEVHYIYACACLWHNPSKKHFDEFVSRLSLNSDSPLSKSPDLVYALAETGVCTYLKTDGSRHTFHHPTGFRTDLEGPHFKCGLAGRAARHRACDPDSRNTQAVENDGVDSDRGDGGARLLPGGEWGPGTNVGIPRDAH